MPPLSLIKRLKMYLQATFVFFCVTSVVPFFFLINNNFMIGNLFVLWQENTPVSYFKESNVTSYQSHISGRTRYKDCPNAWAYKNLGIVGGTVDLYVRSFPRTHLKCTHTDNRVNSARILSSPPLLCAWMNKYRQNYIKMHVLANIRINSRLRKAYVLM